ncbi:MAG: hypothetical protein R8G01_21515 [Ilumatobacteraceae bacterium]|nr:hypothetical protein [Ilumatobacteraceae bacterium]
MAATEEADGVYFDQVGQNIPADAAAMSADGNRLAVETSRADPGGQVPVVRVFGWEGAEWLQLGADIDGAHVKALSGDGDRLVVGVPVEAGGRIRVLEWDGSGWAQLGADIDGEHEFGRSAEISSAGDRVAIGVTGGPSSSAGHVRVFDWDGVAWNQAGADIDGATPAADFGWLVAMSAAGDRIAISERRDEGLVRVVEWDGAGWAQVGSDIEAAGDDLALSGSGDRVAVGMRGEYGAGPWGRVRVFDLVGDVWSVVDDSGENCCQGRPAQSVALSADGHRLIYAGNRQNWPIDSSPGESVVRDEGPTGWTDVGVVRGEFFESHDDWVGLSADGSRLAIGGSGYIRVLDISSTPPPPLAGPVPVAPARLLDSRVGEATVDGLSAGIGVRPAGSVTEVSVAGRGGVPADALSVMLNVAVVSPEAPGFLTVYPCGSQTPLASSLNHAAGEVIANSVFTGFGADGKVCIYSLVATDLIVDVTGYTPRGTGLQTTFPKRLMDSRTGEITTGYEVWDEVNRVTAGTTVSLWALGPFPVPFEASALMLNVTAVDPESAGHLTVHSCDSPRPLASSLNYAAGQVIAKQVFTFIGARNRICIYTHATTDIVVDVTGYTSNVSGLSSLDATRLLDTRVGELTVDGVSAGIGRRPAMSVTRIPVAGRGGVPADATAVMLDVIAVLPDEPGYLTVYPCGTAVPLASNVNHGNGQVISNSVFTGIGSDGTVCIYSHAAVDLVADVTGYTE